jgi:hypothetical protein
LANLVPRARVELATRGLTVRLERSVLGGTQLEFALDPLQGTGNRHPAGAAATLRGMYLITTAITTNKIIAGVVVLVVIVVVAVFFMRRRTNT